jgi:hypothetical protein
MMMGAIPAASRRGADQLVVVVCISTPEAKVRKIASPMSAGEGLWKGPASNVAVSQAI